MSEPLSVTNARANMPQVIKRAQSEPVLLERRGVVQAVVISPARYEQMLEALEEVEDLAAFDAALADQSPHVPWDQVRKDLGWA